jgi:hypothetical protein
VRTLAITQNMTVDGSIELLGDWFSPQGQDGADTSDQMEEMNRESQASDAFLRSGRTPRSCPETRSRRSGR